ncbi:MAG TPA: iron-containing alcohol dehydrogenase, partial [Thermotogota bacterium]|nr:iron-containing alcohol dehydrogenase [Thermotogota bacterium]
MTRMIIGPGKYIQGNGEMKRIARYAAGLGDSFFFIVSENGLKRVEECIRESFTDCGAKLVFGLFQGECSRIEIERIRALFRKEKCSVVVGVGGGKIIDTAKAVAFYENVPVVIAPTIASTDAPCSALSIIYSEEGIFSEILRLSRNPDVVVVDTDIIARAPVRLIVAGMGDALATYFETRACARS